MSEERDGMRRELEERPTEELVSILRNRDAEEWRPEAFEIVAAILQSRGLAPADVAALGPEGIEVVEDQRLVTVGRYFTAVEAHGHRMALEAAGLPAWVADETAGNMFTVAVGTRLRVRAEDEAAAREILKSEPAPDSVLPDEPPSQE